MNKKIISQDSLKKAVGTLKQKHKKIVFTNGCFDVLHRGHIEYLKKARAIGDILVVALNSDASVKGIKGDGRPINRQRDRAAILASLEFVDFVTIFNEDTPLKLIKKLKPDILVKGADWNKDKIAGKAFVESYGGKVVTVRFLKGYSTSKMVSDISRKS